MPEGIGYNSDVSAAGIDDRSKFIEGMEGEFGTPENTTSSTDLKAALAGIQAMNQATPTQSTMGKTIGTGVGTGVGAGVGAYFGNPAAGAAIGSAAGGTIGSIVDYMNNEDSQKKAEQKRTDALMLEKNRLQKKEASDAWLNKLAESQNRTINMFQQDANKYTVARQMQEQLAQQLITKITQAKAREQGFKQSYLDQRRI